MTGLGTILKREFSRYLSGLWPVTYCWVGQQRISGGGGGKRDRVWGCRQGRGGCLGGWRVYVVRVKGGGCRRS